MRILQSSSGLLEALQEVGVRLELGEASEDELHRLDLVYGRERPAQLHDPGKLLGVVELLFLSRAGLRDVDAREDPAVEEVPVENDLGVSRALELLKNDLVHAGARVDRGRGDDGERAPALRVARCPKNPARVLHGSGTDAPRHDLPAALLHVVVGAGHASDRVEKDDGVFSALDEAARPLGNDFGHRDVVLRREVRGGGDDFAPDASPEVGDLLGPLVDEKHDDVDVRIVFRDGVRHSLQERGLAGLRRRDDQAALAAADRRQEIRDAPAHLVRLGLELQVIVGIDRDELGERGPLPEGRRLEPLDAFDPPNDRSVPVDRESADVRSRLQPFAGDQVPRDDGVAGGWQVIRLRGDEDAGRAVLWREEEDALDGSLRPARYDFVRAFGLAASIGARGPAAPTARAASAATPATPAAAMGTGATVTGTGAFRLNGYGRRGNRRNQGIFGH